MTDSPEATRIVSALVQKHGLAGAKAAALDETIKAQNARDYYQLSIWRDVRRILDKDPAN
jgi:hypothetical protein